MRQPQDQIVHLTASLDGTPGPADGHDVRAAHAWVWVAMVEGEPVVFDGDSPPAAIAALERVRVRADWAEYCQDPKRLDVYRYAGGVSNPEEP